MGVVSKGEYNTTAPSINAAGRYTNLQLDKNGNLFTRSRPQYPTDSTVVAGAASTLGKIGTLAATTGYIVAVVDCSSQPITTVDWLVTCDNQWTYQLAFARSNPLACTLTYTDATAVDNTDTFVLNGLTFTAVTSGAVAASHEYNMGADNAAAAANCAALLLTVNGLPGIAGCVVTSPTTTDVLTISCGTATCLQFSQGTSASNEVAYVDTTLANLYLDGAVSGTQAITSTYKGARVTQTLNGYEWAAIKVNNIDGDAATVTVTAIKR